MPEDPTVCPKCAMIISDCLCAKPNPLPTFNVEKLIAELTKIDPSLQKRILNRLGATVKSTETYYNSEAAEAVRPLIDGMINDNQDRLIDYSSYLPIYQPSTVKQKFYSGFKYLIENDEDGKYREAKKHIKIEKVAGGIAIRWKKNWATAQEGKLSFGNAQIIPKSVSMEEGIEQDIVPNKDAMEAGDWKIVLMDFAENGKVGEYRMLRELEFV
jgi:hypothetical protein